MKWKQKLTRTDVTLNFLSTSNCCNKFFVLLSPISFFGNSSRYCLLFRCSFESFLHVDFDFCTLSSVFGCIKHLAFLLLFANTFMPFHSIHIEEAATISACCHIFGWCCGRTLNFQILIRLVDNEKIVCFRSTYSGFCRATTACNCRLLYNG